MNWDEQRYEKRNEQRYEQRYERHEPYELYQPLNCYEAALRHPFQI